MKSINKLLELVWMNLTFDTKGIRLVQARGTCTLFFFGSRGEMFGYVRWATASGKDIHRRGGLANKGGL